MTGKVYQNLRVLTTRKGLQDCHSGTKKLFAPGGQCTQNEYSIVLWGSAFIAFAIVGSIYAERAANAGRINQYFDDPDSKIDTRPYDTCKIPHYSKPSEPKADSFYWKQLEKDVQEYCDYDLDC